MRAVNVAAGKRAPSSSDSCERVGGIAQRVGSGGSLQREVIAIEGEPGRDFPSGVIALTGDRV